MAISLHKELQFPPDEHVKNLSVRTVPEIREVGPGRYLDQHFDPTHGVQWIAFRANGPTKMTRSVVSALRTATAKVEAQARREIATASPQRTRYQVLASHLPGVFNLGGDLEYISSLIRKKDREKLLIFGRDCAELIYKNAVNYELPLTTISLVQGTAMGGGFEAALSSNILVAEKDSKMGLPEVMFNMFPGMGAYQLLKRRVSPIAAERIIQSGRTYSAEEMYDLGIVDVLAEPGDGEQAVWTFIKRHRRQSHAEWGLRRMIQATDPAINRDDLMASIEIWADTALTLTDQDLKHMEFLIRAQKTKGI